MSTEENTVFMDDSVMPQVMHIMDAAREYAIFVTPYLDLWNHLQNAIDKAVDKGVKVSFILRSNNDQRKEDDVNWLIQHRVRVYEVPDLHAKIYLNESSVLISSMNITEHSTTNSLEFAMIVRNKNSAKEFRDYVSQLRKRAKPIESSRSEKREIQETGKCIRCAREISYDSDRPLCEKCYASWAKYGDTEYPEEYCHSCGKPSTVTYGRPLCPSCFRIRR